MLSKILKTKIKKNIKRSDIIKVIENFEKGKKETIELIID
jgi:hypothetical protein